MISYANRRDNLVAIKDIRNFDVNDTITFPISGYKDDHRYQSEYTFMPLISSPGVAFIIVDEPPGTSANAVFNSVLSGWPVLLLTLLMALLSGIIMWGLVSTFYYSLNRRIRLPCLGMLQLCNLPKTTDCMGVSTNRIITTSQMDHHVTWIGWQQAESVFVREIKSPLLFLPLLPFPHQAALQENDKRKPLIDIFFTVL